MELGVEVDEDSRAIRGGESSCGVSTPMVWKPFIRTGWFEVARRGMQSAGGGSSSMHCNFIANDCYNGVEAVGG
jgi:hypothetical protein